MYYIHQYLQQYNNPKIIDIGAGTGAYTIPLVDQGYDVTAIELVKSNLGTLKAKNNNIKAFQGNALDLRRFKDNTFDITLLMGPMYHLFTTKDKLKALNEAKRITKDNGLIFVAYLMNDYSVIMYGFHDNNIKQCLQDGRLDNNFKTHNKENDLYDYMLLEDINKLNELAELKREKIINVDGATHYMRETIKNMDDYTFNLYLQYQLSISERHDLIGASAHTLDILKKY